jgi:uncharacterized protein YndB with AHSA1/START domain/hemerythrin-like domain-containing protein
MTIVHNGLRRDLARVHTALSEWPYPDPVQRAAIADHLTWMIHFLHKHHRAEDDGLYPVVRQRVPNSAGVLDAMDRDHHALTVAMDGVTQATREYAASDASRKALRGAVDELAAVMLPHLQREEDEAMPIVSRCISSAEWDDWDRRFNLDTRSLAERSFDGLWLMDGTGAADCDVVRSLIPRPVAWAIETFKSRDYARRAYRCWYLPQHNRLHRQQPAGRVEVDVAAPPEAVWRVLTDPARIPEWSHECRDVELLDPGPVGLGSRFHGRNRAGRNTWSRVCTVFRCDANTDFAYLTSGGPGDATAWHFRLEPTATGTRLTQAYRIVSMPAWLSVMVGVLISAHRDRTAALREDLLRLAALAEGFTPASAPNSRTGFAQP